MWRIYRRRLHQREDGGTMADGQRRGPKRRKRTHVSKNSSTAGAASRGEEPGPTGRTEVESGGETRIGLVHFDGRPAFTLEDLRAASEVGLGEGTDETVHRATLGDGNQVAVCRLSWADITGEFEAEVNMLGKIRHPNLLALRAYYCSPDGEKNFLVFDYMPKGSLSDFLHGRLRFIRWISDYSDWHRTLREDSGPYNRIDWCTRKNIAIGIARGLHYLHMQNMVHGRLSSGNILLDDHTNAKIADYGLSYLMLPVANFDVIDVAAGASRYHAPELSKLKRPNSKTDVYSLGVIMLELLTGKSPRETISSLHLPGWVAWTMKEQGTDEVFDPDLITDAAGTTRNELLDTLALALWCVDPSPYARPELWQVLQRLEGNKPRFAGDKVAAKTKGGDKPFDGCAYAIGAMTIAAQTTGTDISSSSSRDMLEERTACSVEDLGVGTSETLNVLANDGNLQARMPPMINSCNDKDEELSKLTSKGDLEDGDQTLTSTPTEEIIQGHSGNEDSFVNLSTAQQEGNNGATFPTFDIDEAMVEDKTEEQMITEETDATSGDTVASQLSSIDWAEIPLEAHLEVPTSPPLIRSNPDSCYQRYFQMLYSLAYHSPALPSDVLEVQLNRMIMGLHSLGYPLETWLKAAVFVMGLTKKREYIDHHVDEYFKVHVETQMAEITTAIDPIKEEISRIQSDMSTLEQKQKELDENISKLEDQLAVLKAQRGGVVASLTTSRDQLAAAEAKMQSVLVDKECLNQQYSTIWDLRCELLRELPALDEAFDSSFREILTKKF